MSIRVMAQVWANSRAKGSALLLLLAVADHCGDDGIGYPGVELLAEKIRMSERRTRDLLRELENGPRRELVTERNAGPQGTNRYTVRPGGQSLPPLRQFQGGSPASRGGAVATAPEPGTEPGTKVRPSATQMGAAPPKVIHRGAQGVVREVMEYCQRHSIPKPDRVARSALGQQALNLLQGAYDERDVRETALELAGAFTLYDRHKALMTLQQTVQQRCADRQYEEHDWLKASEPAPDVAAAIGHPLARVPARPGAHDLRDDLTWTKRCATAGCRRIALRGLERCNDHEPDEIRAEGLA